MKKIITDVLYSDLDNTPGSWNFAPMIPASGSFSSESEKKSSGRLRTVKLSFKIYNRFAAADRNLSLLVKFDDNSQEIINRVEFTPTQSGYHFTRKNNRGSYINTKAYYIRYSPDYKVTKIDLDK